MDALLLTGYGLGGAISLLLPTGLAFFLIFRIGLSWQLLGFGALVFFIVEVTRLTALSVMVVAIAGTLVSSSTTAIALFLIFAMIKGMLEEVGRYFGYKYLIKERKNWYNALIFGLGHGGLDAVVFGLSTVASVLNIISLYAVDLSTSTLPPERLTAIQEARGIFARVQWYEPMLGGFEQAFLLAIQICFSVVVLQAFRRSKVYLLWAIIAHAFVTGVAAFLGAYTPAVVAPLVTAVLAAIALYFIFQLRGVDSPKPAPL